MDDFAETLAVHAGQGVWGGGQLLAFSALSGTTRYEEGLIGRTARDRCGFDFCLPAAGGITFATSAPAGFELGGDYFAILLSDGDRIEGALVDACHLLIRGRCEVHGEGHLASHRGELTLVAPQARFDERHLAADLDEILATRRRWRADLPKPPIGDAATERAFLRQRVPRDRDAPLRPRARAGRDPSGARRPAG